MDTLPLSPECTEGNSIGWNKVIIMHLSSSTVDQCDFREEPSVYHVESFFFGGWRGGGGVNKKH